MRILMTHRGAPAEPATEHRGAPAGSATRRRGTAGVLASMAWPLSLVALLIGAGAGCAGPQLCRPYQFLVAPPVSPVAPGAALAAALDPSSLPLQRALAEHQHTLAEINERTGALRTTWEDLGAAPEAGPHLWRRFHIAQTQAQAGLLISVRAEARRCHAGVTPEDDARAAAACAPPEALAPAQQRELDQLGADLQQSLAIQVGAAPSLPTVTPYIIPPQPALRP